MEAVLLLLKHGANVNAMADQRHDYRTVSIRHNKLNEKNYNNDYS